MERQHQYSRFQFIEQKNKIDFMSDTIGTYIKTLEQMTELLDSISLGIISFDSTGKTSIFNNRFLKMWNLLEEDVEITSENELFQMILPKINDPKGFSELIKNINNAINDEIYGVLYLKNGKIYEFICNTSFDMPKYLGRIWTFADITEHINAEKKFSNCYKELKNAKQIIKGYRSDLKLCNELTLDLNEKLANVETFKEFMLKNISSNILPRLNNLWDMLESTKKSTLDEIREKYLLDMQLNLKEIIDIIINLIHTDDIYSKNLNVTLQPIDTNRIITELNQIYNLSPEMRTEIVKLSEDMPSKIMLDIEKIKFLITTLLQYLNPEENSNIRIIISAEKNNKSQKLINLIIEINLYSIPTSNDEINEKLSNNIKTIIDWESNLNLSLCKKLIEKLDGEILYEKPNQTNSKIIIKLKNIVVLDKAWNIMEVTNKTKNYNEKSEKKESESKIDERLQNELNLIFNDAKSLCQNFIIDDIEMFANRIHFLGLKNKNESLKNYAQLLIDATNSFDINTIRKLLNNIDNIVIFKHNTKSK